MFEMQWFLWIFIRFFRKIANVNILVNSDPSHFLEMAAFIIFINNEIKTFLHFSHLYDSCGYFYLVNGTRVLSGSYQILYLATLGWA